jgi:hypothetical protein
MVVSVWDVMMITGLGEPVGHTRPRTVPVTVAPPVHLEIRIVNEARA